MRTGGKFAGLTQGSSASAKTSSNSCNRFANCCLSLSDNVEFDRSNVLFILLGFMLFGFVKDSSCFIFGDILISFWISWSEEFKVCTIPIGLPAFIFW